MSTTASGLSNSTRTSRRKRVLKRTLRNYLEWHLPRHYGGGCWSFEPFEKVRLSKILSGLRSFPCPVLVWHTQLFLIYIGVDFVSRCGTDRLRASLCFHCGRRVKIEDIVFNVHSLVLYLKKNLQPA